MHAAQVAVDSINTRKVVWEATRGRHTLEVRASDGTGATQPQDRAPPFPDGATGWPSVVVTVA